MITHILLFLACMWGDPGSSSRNKQRYQTYTVQGYMFPWDLLNNLCWPSTHHRQDSESWFCVALVFQLLNSSHPNISSTIYRLQNEHSGSYKVRQSHTRLLFTRHLFIDGFTWDGTCMISGINEMKTVSNKTQYETNISVSALYVKLLTKWKWSKHN